MQELDAKSKDNLHLHSVYIWSDNYYHHLGDNYFLLMKEASLIIMYSQEIMSN